MRHRVAAKHFNRNVTQRQALIKGLVRNLVLHGEITTTKAKAQETKRWADKLISRARKNDLNTRRVLHRFFGARDIVNTLVDTIAPLFDVNSGFTTSKSLGVRRGDNAEMVKLELVKKPTQTGSFKNPQPQAETKKPAVKAEPKKATKPAAKKAPVKAAKPAKKATSTAKTATKKPAAKKATAKKATKK